MIYDYDDFKDPMTEIWRDIKEYEGLYQVSNYGRVRVLDRLVKCGYSKTRIIKGKVLSQFKNNSGYLMVDLTINKKTKMFLAHRLVAFAFPEICGEWFEGAEVNHINCIKTDNRAENIEWCTKSYNQNYMNRNINMLNSRKLRNRCNKGKVVHQLTIEDELIKVWNSTREIERAMGYNHTLIINCCKEKIGYKTAYGYKWKYGYESEIEAKLDTYRMPVDVDTINHLYFKNRYSKIGKETIF